MLRFDSIVFNNRKYNTITIEILVRLRWWHVHVRVGFPPTD